MFAVVKINQKKGLVNGVLYKGRSIIVAMRRACRAVIDELSKRDAINPSNDSCLEAKVRTQLMEHGYYKLNPTIADDSIPHVEMIQIIAV